MNLLCGAVGKRPVNRISSEFMKVPSRLALIFLISLLTACGSTPQMPPPAGEDPLLPMPGEFNDEPGDQALKEALRQYFAQNRNPAASQYDFNRIDLNGDNRRDALVLLKSPYGYWCDVNGCPMLVFQADDEDFDFVNAIQSVRGPIYVSRQSTNGWKDLMVRVSGRWSETKDVAMQYDGTQYPTHPDMLPPYGALAQSVDQKIFR